MSNTDIIPGMTEVMDYIKKQEEEIKDLNNRLMTCKMSIAIRDTEINELKEECYKRGHCEEVVETYEKGILKRNNESKNSRRRTTNSKRRSRRLKVV